MSSNCTIEPNPDISGIGVRTAIYAQAVLTLVQPLLASLDGRISESELVGLHQLYLGILLPGCALLFSAIIQARTFGLSVYHGMIVLNLSWINNTSALIFFEFALIAQLKLDRERDFRRRVATTLKLLYESLLHTVDSGDVSKRSEALTAVVARVQRLRLALVAGVTKPREDFKLEGSKEILENITQGLELLEIYVNSLKGAVAEGEVAKASEALKKFIKKERTRHLLSLGMQRVRHHGPATRVLGRMKRAMHTGKFAPFISGGGKIISLLQRDWTMASLASAHLTLFAAFGLWLWFTIHHFSTGSNDDCEPFTTLFIFRSIPVTSPALRKVSIIIYIICLLPIINIVVFGGMELAAIYGFQRLVTLLRRLRRRRISQVDLAPPQNDRRPQGASAPLTQSPFDTPYILYEFIVLTLGVQVFFIVSTELTIKNNARLVNQNEEEDWTFGQTLAVALTVIPLIQVTKEIWNNLVGWWERSRKTDGAGEEDEPDFE